MREEEASVGVVGVCISLAVLVMDSVVASPFVHAVLQREVEFGLCNKICMMLGVLNGLDLFYM